MFELIKNYFKRLRSAEHKEFMHHLKTDKKFAAMMYGDEYKFEEKDYQPIDLKEFLRPQNKNQK